MEKYKRILVAVELNAKTDREIIKKTLEIIQKNTAKLVLVHAVEYISGYGYGLPYSPIMNTEIEDVLLKHVKAEMEKIGKNLGVDKKQQIVKFGAAKFIILEEAERIKADLIIVGSHGRHGVRMLLGSTANAVLHGAKCDVLAVRLERRKKN